MTRENKEERERNYEERLARTPTEQAYDIVRSWFEYLGKNPDEEPDPHKRETLRETLLTRFDLYNPATPDRDEVHKILARLVGADHPLPSEAPESFQHRDTLYKDGRGRILQIISFEQQVIEGKVASRVWVEYTVERDVLQLAYAAHAGSVAVEAATQPHP